MSGQAADNGTAREAGPARARARRAPRPITRGYLENVALAYLARFAATAKGLETVLMRRVSRSAAHHGSDPADGAALVRALVARYRDAGLIDDGAFAEARARTLHQRGLPLRAIALRLRQKGVGVADIDRALAQLAEDAALPGGEPPDRAALDTAAARAYARRRRLGPWRTPARRAEMRERDLAALARAGFSYGVARAALDGPPDDAGA